MYPQISFRHRVSRILCGAAIVTLLAARGSSYSSDGTSGPQWLGCNADHQAANIGININNLSFDSLQSGNLINALRQSGAGWTRINLYWGWIERKPGQFEWAAADSGLRKLKAAHIQVLLTIDGPVPCWALGLDAKSGCKNVKNTVPPTGPWVTFVTTAVQRYHNLVQYWEIWNEPDLIQSLDIPNPQQRLIGYRNNILIPGAAAIRRVDPGAKIAGPTFAAIPSGDTAPGDELERALALVFTPQARQNVDIVSLHSYFPSLASDKARTARVALQRLGMGVKPIWIDELGAEGIKIAPRGHDVAKKQASYLDAELSDALGSGAVSKIFWFALTDSTNVAGAHTNDYGLIDNHDYNTFAWAPRSAFIELQSVVRQGCSK